MVTTKGKALSIDANDDDFIYRMQRTGRAAESVSKGNFFFKFMEEGWSVCCSRGRARIKDNDHKYLLLTSEQYRRLLGFREDYGQRKWS
jgi:hypothetical protein